MVNTEAMLKWENALSEYQQGEGALKPGNNEYCCYGVLCEISPFNDWSPDDSFPPNNVLEWAGISNLFRQDYVLGGRLENQVSISEELREEVEWFLDNNDDSDIIVEFGTTKLSDLNDSGVPFNVIAKIIRENWIDNE